MSDCAEIFTDIYDRKVWGDGSGGGTADLVAGPFGVVVRHVINRFELNTVVDVGCGDGCSALYWRTPEINYIGVDVVPEMVDYCRERHPDYYFVCMDSTRDLPAGDLAVCKEMTQHLGDDDLRALLERLKKFPLVLHCSTLIPGDAVPYTGGCRPVVLSQPPWNLPAERLLEWSFADGRWHAELWRPR